MSRQNCRTTVSCCLWNKIILEDSSFAAVALQCVWRSRYEQVKMAGPGYCPLDTRMPCLGWPVPTMQTSLASCSPFAQPQAPPPAGAA